MYDTSTRRQFKIVSCGTERVEKIVEQLNEVFGTHGDKLTASYGTIHEYSGMTIDW